MQNLRILTIGWEYPPHITGGLGIACQGLVRALARKGHWINFLVPRLWGDEARDEGIELTDVKSRLLTFSEDQILRLSKQFEIFMKNRTYGAYESAQYRPPGVGLSESTLSSSAIREAFLEMPMQGGYGDQLYEEIQRYSDFASILATGGNFDLIHAHDWMTYPAGLAARSISGKPLICHVHATEFDRSGESVNQYVYDLERHAFHSCDAIITVSNYTRNILIQRYGVQPEKIFAVHNGIEFEIPESIVENNPVDRTVDDKIVLFLGRITFQKGPDYFVRAAKIVIDKLKNVRFVMAGTGDMYHRIIEMAADLGIGKYFHYTGFLNRQQTRKIYEMSDLYIMPSVSEPFGISPLEAMMHGIPVIVSKQSGVSEIISNCMKVDFWNVNEIADSIIHLLTDNELNTKLRKHGHYEARNITWDMAADRIQDVYRQVHERNRP